MLFIASQPLVPHVKLEKKLEYLGLVQLKMYLLTIMYLVIESKDEWDIILALLKLPVFMDLSGIL